MLVMGEGMADRRARSADRKGEIVSSTLDLILEYGLAGATMSKIAGKVGITEPALYRHFKNRKEIMLASLDMVAIRIRQGFSIDEKDVPSYIRRVSQATYRSLTEHPKDARLILEFLCAPPSEDLRETVVERLFMTLGFFQAFLGEGIDKGALREDIDRELVAWQLFSLGFTLAFVSSLGLPNILPEEKALRALEDLLVRISKL